MNNRRYTTINDPQLSDKDLIWDVSNSDWRLTPFSDLLTLFQNNLVFPDAGRPEPNTQYSSPSATGFSVQVNDNNEDTHLVLTPLSTFAAGTIVLPANTSVRDKQIAIINTTQQITSLTIDKNGAAGVTGVPASLGADDYLTFKYDTINDSWYRIG
jgi:hypothetical protein